MTSGLPLLSTPGHNSRSGPNSEQTSPPKKNKKKQRWHQHLTFILSMLASIFSCSTSFLACAMLAVLLLAIGAATQVSRDPPRRQEEPNIPDQPQSSAGNRFHVCRHVTRVRRRQYLWSPLLSSTWRKNVRRAKGTRSEGLSGRDKPVCK